MPVFQSDRFLRRLSLTCQNARRRLSGECVTEWTSCVGPVREMTTSPVPVQIPAASSPDPIERAAVLSAC